MKDHRPRWEVERDRLNTRIPPAQTWAFRQWWLYGIGGLVLTIASFSDDEPCLLLPAAVASLAAAFGYRHRG